MDQSIPRPTQRQQAKAATRAKVVAAATALFNAKSYDLVTMRDIADKANVSTGSIFASFTGKQAVWEACAGARMPRPDEWRATRAGTISHAAERVWRPMKSSTDLPVGRGVLLRSTETPFGAPVRSPEGRVEWMMHLGYRGAKAGVWVGGAYYPDHGARITSAVFTHWADAPTFDGE